MRVFSKASGGGKKKKKIMAVDIIFFLKGQPSLVGSILVHPFQEHPSCYFLSALEVFWGDIKDFVA